MLWYYVIPILILVFFYFKNAFNFWRNRGIPQRTQWNILGDFWDVGFKYHSNEKIDLMYKEFKNKAPFFGFYSLWVPMAIITDLDLMRSVLVKDFNNFVDHGMYHDEEADKLSMHLFSIEGEKWRRMRNALSPVFTSGKMKSMFHIIEEKGRDFVEFLERGSKNPDGLCMKSTNTKFTADVVASAAFGLETKALSTPKPFIMEILKKAFESTALTNLYFMFLISFPRFSAKMKLRFFHKDCEDFFSKTIHDTMEYREKNGIKRSDFLNMLINLKNHGTIVDSGEVNPAGKLTFNEVLAQAFVFFAAGYETSSTAMSFALYFIAKHPDVQKKLREEIRTVKARHNGHIDYEALMEMTYLNQVFNGKFNGELKLARMQV